MQKISTIFKRDFSQTYRVLDEINPACQWVFEGQGTTYRKWQGMAAMILGNEYYKRCIVKKNQVLPAGFILCTHDLRAEKQFGWMPVNPELPQDQFYIQAFDKALPDGTYELIGPKIHGNPENFSLHILINHTSWEVSPLKRTYKEIKNFLSQNNFEGLVFHHPDGRMAKIKKKDFGLSR